MCIYICVYYVQHAWNPIHEAGMTSITSRKKKKHALTMAHKINSLGYLEGLTT